jgi:DNA replication protein DnaC
LRSAKKVCFSAHPTLVSHLAQAIGRAVIQQGYRVVYREAHILLEELADATLDGTRKAYLI